MAEGKPGRGSDQFPLRLPDGMRDRLKAAAAKNSRSMNAEIVARLEDSFELTESLTDLQQNAGEAMDAARKVIEDQAQRHENLKETVERLTMALEGTLELERRRVEALQNLGLIVDDVHAVIRAIGQEVNGDLERPSIDMQTPLGKMLASAIDGRTDLAMRHITQALAARGLLQLGEDDLDVELNVPSLLTDQKKAVSLR